MYGIKETGILKTREQWRESRLGLTKFLRAGDAVDMEMYDYFLCVLPPACNSSQCLQIGEPYSHTREGTPTFMTLINVGNKWIYAGEIETPKGEKCLYRE